MTEATKTCPSCGAQVLAGAHVCKECRYRFDPSGDQTTSGGLAGRLLATRQTSTGGTQPPDPPPGTLTAPPRPARRPVPPIVWILGAVVAIGAVIAIAVSSGGGSSSSSSPSSTGTQEAPVITGVDVESKLDNQLASQTSQAVSNVSCPNKDLYAGDTLDCDVTFDSGRTQGIVVTVTGTANSPHLEISLR